LIPVSTGAPGLPKISLVILCLAMTLTGCGTGNGDGSGSNSSNGRSETSSSSAPDDGGERSTANSGTGARADRPQSRAAQCYVDAVNDETLDGLVGCFATGGVVVDVSRRIEGRNAIRGWAQSEVIGGTLRVIESEPRENGVRLLVHWAPAGSDGWRGYYTFKVSNGRITVADLQYA